LYRAAEKTLAQSKQMNACTATAIVAIGLLIVVLMMPRYFTADKEGFVEYIVYEPGFVWWRPRRRHWWRRRFYAPYYIARPEYYF
jgi:hypothetical protein